MAVPSFNLFKGPLVGFVHYHRTSVMRTIISERCFKFFLWTTSGKSRKRNPPLAKNYLDDLSYLFRCHFCEGAHCCTFTLMNTVFNCPHKTTELKNYPNQFISKRWKTGRTTTISICLVLKITLVTLPTIRKMTILCFMSSWTFTFTDASFRRHWWLPLMIIHNRMWRRFEIIKEEMCRLDMKHIVYIANMWYLPPKKVVTENVCVKKKMYTIK